MATRNEISDVLSMLRVAYPKYQPPNPGAMIALYERKLSRFDNTILTAAVDKIIEESKWFPALSEIIERAELLERTRPRKSLDEIRAELEAESWMPTREEWKALALALHAEGRKSAALAT